MSDSTEVHRKEADFHDEWAESTALEDVEVRAAFEASTAPENRFIVSQMGDLAGKRLLDIGPGLGESSVYFALRGAHVTMVDISPNMIELGQRLAAANGVKVEGLVSAAESLNVPEASFDFVYIANLLHHVHDRPTLFRQVRAALKPGGQFFSWDPIAYNPVINVYRRMATDVRTDDEAPLTTEDLRVVRELFADSGHREFWLSSLSIFLKYYFVDRVHPNEDRYWKRILREREEGLGWFRALQRLDGALTRLPGVRWLAWNMVMWGRKPEA